MMTVRTTIAALGIALAVLMQPVMAGQLDDGKAAFERGDYATAAELLRPLAEQGNAEAQLGLGLMYRNGQGVPQDYAEAVKWFRKAAEQGFAFAQYNLGIMYFHGRGVAQDYVLAHMWFNLGAAAGFKEAAKFRETVSKRMTPEQIAEAQRLAREWQAAHPPK